MVTKYIELNEEYEKEFKRVLKLRKKLDDKNADKVIHELSSLEHKLQQIKGPLTLTVSFFGETNQGKSYIINSLLQMGTEVDNPRMGPLPSEGGGNEGLTSCPVLVCHTENESEWGLIVEFCTSAGNDTDEKTCRHLLTPQEVEKSCSGREQFYQKVSSQLC